jgi:hypothetical protein
MLKTEPPSSGWLITTDHNHLTKTFNFNSSEKLVEFLLGILQVEHDPGDPILEAVEKPKILSIVVNLDLHGHSDRSVTKMVNEVESIFVGCIYGKNRTFWVG